MAELSSLSSEDIIERVDFIRDAYSGYCIGTGQAVVKSEPLAQSILETLIKFNKEQEENMNKFPGQGAAGTKNVKSIVSMADVKKHLKISKLIQISFTSVDDDWKAASFYLDFSNGQEFQRECQRHFDKYLSKARACATERLSGAIEKCQSTGVEEASLMHSGKSQPCQKDHLIPLRRRPHLADPNRNSLFINDERDGLGNGAFNPSSIDSVSHDLLNEKCHYPDAGNNVHNNINVNTFGKHQIDPNTQDTRGLKFFDPFENIKLKNTYGNEHFQHDLTKLEFFKFNQGTKYKKPSKEKRSQEASDRALQLILPRVTGSFYGNFQINRTGSQLGQKMTLEMKMHSEHPSNIANSSEFISVTRTPSPERPQIHTAKKNKPAAKKKTLIKQENFTSKKKAPNGIRTDSEKDLRNGEDTNGKWDHFPIRKEIVLTKKNPSNIRCPPIWSHEERSSSMPIGTYHDLIRKKEDNLDRVDHCRPPIPKGCARTDGLLASIKYKIWKSEQKGANGKQPMPQHINAFPFPSHCNISQSSNVSFLSPSSTNRALKVDKSGIHAWGLFALETIHINEFIIYYVGDLVSHRVAALREARYVKKGIGSSYLFRCDKYHVVDATVKGNIARYMNHSRDPNSTAKILTTQKKEDSGDKKNSLVAGGVSDPTDQELVEKKIAIYARRLIRPGEEITYDYKFPLEENNKIPCRCGSQNCRGFLN